MAQNLGSRLSQLEAGLSHLSRRENEVRVAGKSPLELNAELLTDLFVLLDSKLPGFAAALVEAAMHEDERQIPADDSPDHDRMLYMVFKVTRNAEQRNPGLPQRILDAVMSGAEAITEETLFPKGRPPDEETYYSRQGKRFCYRLDSRDHRSSPHKAGRRVFQKQAELTRFWHFEFGTGK